MGHYLADFDWDLLERDWTAWWNQDIRRPMLICVSMTPAQRARPSWWGGLGQMPHEIPAAAIAEEAFDDVQRIRHDGDAWPRFWMNYGPGIGAALLGGGVKPARDTVWFTPGIWQDKPLREIRPVYDPANRWWQRVQEVTRACVARFGRQAQVGFTDIGGNLDIAASLRGCQELLMDCLDDPEAVTSLCQAITPLWLRFYAEQAAVIEPAGRGTSSWGPLWSPGRTYMLQSDFSYMISPDQFARWVVPDLAACCAKLDHGFYHLDGKGELPHLGHLLAVPGLKGVQWIPGDGQPEAGDPVWWPIFERIRAAGKLVQIYTSGESALRMAHAMPLTGFAIDTSTRDHKNQDQLVAEIQRTNARLTARPMVSVP